MIEVLKGWFTRYFSDEEAIYLAIILAASLGIILLLGKVLAPFIAAMVIAYMLQEPVEALQRRKVPHLISVSVISLLLVGVEIAILLVLLPLVWNQTINLINALPKALSGVESLLMRLPEQYPQFIDKAQVEEWVAGLADSVAAVGQPLLAASLDSLPGLFGIVLFLILVPFLVFFFLKDKEQLLATASRFLPDKRGLLKTVWKEMDEQIANYIRGKLIEIVVVFVVTMVVFLFLDLKYAVLLSLLVGLSVVVPYVGAILATIPVAIVGFLQFGTGPEFTAVLVWYLVIQAADGNVLVPLLFSEAVNLHPVFIILSIMVFGSLWGFWGVFFAIPLATLLKAVINAWPSTGHESVRLSES